MYYYYSDLTQTCYYTPTNHGKTYTVPDGEVFTFMSYSSTYTIAPYFSDWNGREYTEHGSQA